ncbi:MAG: RsmD family RNA methyltransferase [Pirellulales bacterium]
MNARPRPTVPPTWLRIVGGQLRSQRVLYGGQSGLRPMKDRVREALFNLLGPLPPDMVALDLFAGTGILGIEAISRGARRAVLVERDRGHVVQIRENVDRLKLSDRVDLMSGDTFQLTWRDRMPADAPWLVFCCPPYAFYHDMAAEMTRLLAVVAELAPPSSELVVEAELTSELSCLPPSFSWDLRRYPPAVLALGSRPAVSPGTP